MISMHHETVSSSYIHNKAQCIEGRCNYGVGVGYQSSVPICIFLSHYLPQFVSLIKISPQSTELTEFSCQPLAYMHACKVTNLLRSDLEAS